MALNPSTIDFDWNQEDNSLSVQRCSLFLYRYFFICPQEDFENSDEEQAFSAENSIKIANTSTILASINKADQQEIILNLCKRICSSPDVLSSNSKNGLSYVLNLLESFYSLEPQDEIASHIFRLLKNATRKKIFLSILERRRSPINKAKSPLELNLFTIIFSKRQQFLFDSINEEILRCPVTYQDLYLRISEGNVQKYMTDFLMLFTVSERKREYAFLSLLETINTFSYINETLEIEDNLATTIPGYCSEDYSEESATSEDENPLGM